MLGCWLQKGQQVLRPGFWPRTTSKASSSLPNSLSTSLDPLITCLQMLGIAELCQALDNNPPDRDPESKTALAQEEEAQGQNICACKSAASYTAITSMQSQSQNEQDKLEGSPSLLPEYHLHTRCHPYYVQIRSILHVLTLRSMTLHWCFTRRLHIAVRPCLAQPQAPISARSLYSSCHCSAKSALSTTLCTNNLLAYFMHSMQSYRRQKLQLETQRG
ncbi:hypothetical protein HBH69_219680 [Parastagonospora nodorum]|nr:hypothetical protein HBH69_219680 [Parastagonospora nodorum]